MVRKNFNDVDVEPGLLVYDWKVKKSGSVEGNVAHRFCNIRKDKSCAWSNKC